MASTRFPVPEIQSYTPGIDAKAVESNAVLILEGSRNYCFDSKGPKSWFGSLLVAGGKIEMGINSVQSIRIAKKVIVFTGSGAYEQRVDSQGFFYWHKLVAFTGNEDNGIGVYRWTSAYVGTRCYFCHKNYGVFRLEGDSLVPFNAIGMPERVIAIGESRGRLILVNRYAISYSNAFSGDDLTPTVGGAGFQTIAEIAPGVPVALLSFSGGFTLWTDAGVILAEYVGGEAVFRFDRVITEYFMLSANSWTQLPSGEHVIVTKQGLFRSSAQSGMAPMTPQFNEFFRGVIKDSPEFIIRLDYIEEVDHLYVQIMDSSALFSRTFVLSMNLDKWGEFSQHHRGICRLNYESSNYGYFDADGFAHRFMDIPFRENQKGELIGLDSEIIIGYVRPAQQTTQADVEFEIQEILVSAIETLGDSGYPEEEDWLGTNSLVSWNLGFFSGDEDFSGFTNPLEGSDFNEPAPDEDYNDPDTIGPEYWVYYGSPDSYVYYPTIGSGLEVYFADEDDNEQSLATLMDYNDPGTDEDYNLTPVGGVDTAYVYDWEMNYRDEPDEDWNGKQSLFNRVSYGLEVISNLDGYEDDLSVVPSLAVRRPKTDLWTLFSSGHNHRIRFKATQPWEKFHVTSLEITVNFSGQLS